MLKIIQLIKIKYESRQAFHWICTNTIWQVTDWAHRIYITLYCKCYFYILTALLTRLRNTWKEQVVCTLFLLSAAIMVLPSNWWKAKNQNGCLCWPSSTHHTCMWEMHFRPLFYLSVSCLSSMASKWHSLRSFFFGSLKLIYLHEGKRLIKLKLWIGL